MARAAVARNALRGGSCRGNDPGEKSDENNDQICPILRRQAPHFAGEDGIENRPMHDHAGTRDMEGGRDNVHVAGSSSAEENRAAV